AGVDPQSPLYASVSAAFATVAGDPVEWLKLQQGLTAVRGLDGVAMARFTVERSANPTRTTVTINIDASAAAKPGAATGFPTLLRTDSTLVTVIAGASFGAYSDSNPWFGDGATFTRLSPVAKHPATGRRATWVEGVVEAGAGAITQLGSAPLYVYGAATVLWDASAGQDLFTNETRSMIATEKLYAGLLYADKASHRSANLSFGRQNYTLDDGFLISQFNGSANAGPRPGLYLNPRTAFDMTALLNIRLGNLRLKGFYLDPDEIEEFESNTNFAGANVNWQVTPKVTLGVTYITIPRSDSRFRLPGGGSVPREGEATLAVNLRLDDVLGVAGSWVQGEYAGQWNGDETRAWAGYATIGWRVPDSSWQPSLSYRYSAFSGDDPATPRYERYDPLMSGGLAEWVQGINLKKLFGNANMNVQRLRATARPAGNLTLTLDLFDFKARE
ncbi:MAG: alginate export family protein, partial [Polymorphobacter sp.]